MTCKELAADPSLKARTTETAREAEKNRDIRNAAAAGA